ncbi:MAG: ABC transporter substrate-binding protein, partial [Deltaproteobacteria bacterium]|nr:ABC transporter substrate-binding protein [Deltaproteobacteria bacterium]
MRKRALLMSLIFCLMGILAGGALAQDKVKVGVILPLTGELAKFGEIERKSFLI